MTVIHEAKVELLREKNIKPLEHANKATGYELSDFFNLDKQIPSNNTTHLKTAHNEDSEHPSTEWLEEQHSKDTQTIEVLRYELKESERKRKAEAESSDTWRAKYRAADTELEKAKVKHDAEVRNLKYDIQLLNKALEAHAGDEQLLLLTMKKAVSFAERVKVE